MFVALGTLLKCRGIRALAGMSCLAAFALRAATDDDPELQPINTSAPNRAAEVEKVLQDKAKRDAVAKTKAQVLKPPADPRAEQQQRWERLEANGLINGPELSAPNKSVTILPKPVAPRAAKEPGDEAVVAPEIASGVELKPQLDADKKTNAKTQATRVARAERDPEQARAVPGENDAIEPVRKSAPATTAVNAAPKALRPSDPEFVRPVPAADGDALKPAPKQAEVLAPVAAKSTTAETAPRLVANSAEKDELRPAPILPEVQPSPLPAATAQNNPPVPLMLKKDEAPSLQVTANKDASAPVAIKNDAADSNDESWKPKNLAFDDSSVKSRFPTLPPSLQGARDKTPLKQDAANKLDDDQLAIQKLIQDIKGLSVKLNQLSKAEAEKQAEAAKNSSGMRFRDEHVLKVFSALSNNNTPGGVAVKVFDSKSKVPLNARVCIKDMTETTASAPIKDGFFCKGITQPISVLPGVVGVEIDHGGRFTTPFMTGLNVKPGELVNVDVPVVQLPQRDFEARGYVLADLDIGLRPRAGESRVWFGTPATIDDLILAAQAEGVKVLGVVLPQDDPKAAALIHAAAARVDPSVLVLPVFASTRHAFSGTAMGLGVESWGDLQDELNDPVIPLRDSFDLIHAQQGLAVFSDVTKRKTVSIEKGGNPLLKSLKENGYFPSTAEKANLQMPAELPFDTITAGYDLLSFDGSNECESLWFNLLNEGAPVQIVGSGGGSLEGGRIPFGQTFIQTNGKTTRANVLAAIQQGRTIVSFGPAVFCKVLERDMGPGSVLPNDGRALQLQVQAFSSSTKGAMLDRIEIVRNGKVVYEQKAVEGEADVNDLRYPFSETSNSWYVVRVTERIVRGKGEDDIVRRAWTSPIYFRGATFAAPKMAMAQIHGVLRKGLTPVRGTVTAIAVGQAPVRIETKEDGSYSIEVPAAGSLVFRAEDCQPVAVRVFEHERIQREMGRLLSSEDPMGALSKSSVFGMWRWLLRDLEWNIRFAPEQEPQTPATKLPEPE